MLTGDVGQGGPGDEDGVEGDEGRLQQPRVRLGILQTQRRRSGLILAQGEVAGPPASRFPPPPHLDFGQDGHGRDDDAEDEVDADEDLALRAALGLGVVNIEQRDGRNGGSVEDEGDSAKGWGRKEKRKGAGAEPRPSLQGSSRPQDEVPGAAGRKAQPHRPAYQPLALPSPALRSHSWLQEWAKSMRRMSWMRMKRKEPTTPK